MTMATQDLVDRIRSGDKEAVGEAYDTYFTPVMNFVYYTIYDYEAAKDISQDAFLKVVEAVKDPHKDVRDFKSYLFATARNMAMDEARRANRFREFSAETVTAEDTGVFSDPTRASMLAEQRAQVAVAVSRLNEHQRTALTLKDVSGWSYDDIGQVLGLSRNAVGVLLSRARLKFRKEFRLQQVDADRMPDRCRDLLPLFCAVVDGEATERERSIVEEHLRTCPGCREAMEEMAGASTTMRSMVPLAPIVALKAVLIAKAAGIGAGVAAGTAAGAAAGAGMGLASKTIVGIAASILVAGAGVGAYVGIKKAVEPPPAPFVRVTVPAQGEALQRPVDARGMATVKVMMEVDNKPHAVELSIDGQTVHRFESGPYTYTWETGAAGPHTLKPTAFDSDGKAHPGAEVAFTLAIETAIEGIGFVRGGDIWTVGLDGSGERRLTELGNVTDFSGSADGALIALTASDSALCLAGGDGGGLRQVTPGAYGLVQFPACSPGGEYVYYIRTTPEDVARRDRGEDYSIVFERYNVGTGTIEPVFEMPGLFESKTPAGLLAAPDGTTLYVTMYTGQYPGSEVDRVLVGPPAGVSTLYQPVTDSGDIEVANWILMSVSSDGAMLSCMEEARLKTTVPGDAPSHAEYVCLRSVTGGDPTVIGTNEPGFRKAGRIDAVEWSRKDPSSYYVARITEAGSGSDTLAFYRGAVGTEGDSPLGLTVGGIMKPAGVIKSVWHPVVLVPGG